MFTHHLVRSSWTSHEIQRDGKIETVLHVRLVKPVAPGSRPETQLTEAIVEYMKSHDEIVRADIGGDA